MIGSHKFRTNSLVASLAIAFLCVPAVPAPDRIQRSECTKGEGHPVEGRGERLIPTHGNSLLCLPVLLVIAPKC